MISGEKEKHDLLFVLLQNIFDGQRGLLVEKLEYTWEEVFSAIEDYEKWIENIYKDFSIKKYYSLEHLAEQLFANGEITKSRCKLHIVALSNSIQILKKELENSHNAQYPVDMDYIKGKLSLLRDLLWDGYELIGSCEEHFLTRPASVGLGRRRLFGSNEIFFSSRDLLRRHFYYSDITFSSLSVFQIRQSIEIKILNLLGIGHIIDENDELAKFKLDKLVEFIDKNDHIEFPIDKSILLKIVKWTNTYIHRGIMNYHWLIVLAHEVLMPLFSSGEGQRIISMHGSVKIDKEYFDNQLENELLNYLNLENSTIVKLDHPEAIIE